MRYIINAVNKGVEMPFADVDKGQGPGEVHRRTEVGLDPRCSESPPEPDGLGQQPAAVDLGTPRRADDRRIVRVARCGHR